MEKLIVIAEDENDLADILSIIAYYPDSAITPLAM